MGMEHINLPVDILFKFFILSVIAVMAFCAILFANKLIRSLSKEDTKRIASFIFSRKRNIVEILVSSFIDINKDRRKTEENNTKHSEKEQKNKAKKEINNYLEEEFYSAKATRAIFTNLFFFSTVIVISAFIYLDKLNYEVRITIGCIYFGLSLFILFIIKSCYSRIAVIFSILEDQDKKSDIRDFFVKYKKGTDMNEHDIELIKIMNISRAEREKTAKHPYELILKNISGSSLSFGSSKINIKEKKDEPEKEKK